MGGAAMSEESDDDTDRNDDVREKDRDVHLNWKKIALVGTIPILLIFLGFFFVVKWIGGENYSLAVDWFNEKFGLTGIFV